MKLPTSLIIGPHRYIVEGNDRLIVHGDRRGSTDVENHIMQIAAADISASLRREALLHETLHAAWDQTSLRLAPTAEHEEAVITALAPILLDALRRNRRLVEYLLDGS